MNETSATIIEKYKFKPRNSKSRKEYFLFSLANGEEVELMVSPWVFMRHEVGESGMLHFEGDRFEAFVLPPHEEEKKNEIDNIIATKKKSHYFYIGFLTVASFLFNDSNLSHRPYVWVLLIGGALLYTLYNKKSDRNIKSKLPNK